MNAEIFVLFGEHFRLPLAVQWPDSRQVAKVLPHPEVAFLKCQIAAAAERLNSVGFSQDGAWFITAESLSEIACPSSVTDPEEIVWWAPERVVYSLPVSDESLEMPEGALARRKFLAAFVNAMGLTAFESVEELEVFMVMFCNFAASWVLEHNQVLDLVWCQIVASPLWPGWEKRIDETMRSSLPSHKRQYTSAKTVQGKIANWIYNPQMRKADAMGRIESRWPVITPTDEWIRMAVNGEILRKRHMREWRYVDLIDNRLKAMIPHLLAHYAKYRRTKEALSSVPNVFPNHIICPGACEVVHKRPGSRAGGIKNGLAGLKKSHAHRRAAKAAGTNGTAGGQDAPLPYVPDLQPAESDLRNQNATVVQPGDPKNGAGGVLVPLPIEGEIQSGDMLGEDLHR